MDTLWFDYIILPVLILLARIVDVSLDTIRVIMVTKGYKKYAPFIGFFQVLIWIITITRIMANLDNWPTYIGYAGGFALGTYVGMRLEEKLALGYELVRVVTRADASRLIESLRDHGYPVTSVAGWGKDGEVGILFIILKRKSIREVVDIIKRFNPNAFYTVEDMRFVSSGGLLKGTESHRRTRYGPR
ncbi:MAG: DUF2179 domain-containing protein [Bacteroidales bacterium]|nr:DUF2179 domain-containing protein [Bacteroidales bacterium]